MIGHLFESGPWKVLGIEGEHTNLVPVSTVLPVQCGKSQGLTDNQISTGLQTRREVVQGRDLEL